MNRTSSVKIKNSAGIVPVTINLNQDGHYDLLKKAYNDVFVKAFLDEDERDPLEKWIARLENNDNPNGRHHYTILVTGDNLNNKSPNISGISVGIYYKQSDSGLLAYNAISSEARGNGLGKLMVEWRKSAFQEFARSHGRSLRAIFLEVCDPQLANNDLSSIDPQLRQDMFKKWGGEIIPFRYIQPALAENQKPYEGANLMYYPTQDGSTPTFKAVYDFLNQVFYDFKNTKEFKQTIESLIMLAQSNGHQIETFENLPEQPIIPSNTLQTRVRPNLQIVF